LTQRHVDVEAAGHARAATESCSPKARILSAFDRPEVISPRPALVALV